MEIHLEIFSKIIDELQELRTVAYIENPDLPYGSQSIKLTFDTDTVYIIVNDYDDTVYVSSTLPEELQHLPARDVSRNGLWARAIGRWIRWIWILQNQQGYEDAVQIEFASKNTEIATIVQMVAIASQLTVYEVHPIWL